MWGKRSLLEELEPYKLRPAPDSLPGKWMTGTQNHEGIAGTLAAVDYLADLGRVLVQDPALPRRESLAVAYGAIGDYERGLTSRLLEGLRACPTLRSGESRTRLACTTGSPPSRSRTRGTPGELAQWLGERGVFVWHGNYYALPLTEALGLEPEGMVRIGLLHYNTTAEVDYLLELLGQC